MQDIIYHSMKLVSSSFNFGVEMFDDMLDTCYIYKIKEHHKSELGEVVDFMRKSSKIEAVHGIQFVAGMEPEKMRDSDIYVIIDIDEQFNRKAFTKRSTRDRTAPPYEYAYVLSFDHMTDDLKLKCSEAITKFLTKKSIKCEQVFNGIRIGASQFKSLIRQANKISDLDLEGEMYNMCLPLDDKEERTSKMEAALKNCQSFTAEQLKVFEGKMKNYLKQGAIKQTSNSGSSYDESVASFRAERATDLLNKGFSKKEITNILDMSMDELDAIEARMKK